MPVLLDTGIVYAYYDASDDWHSRALSVFDESPGPFLLPALVIPEVDHLLGQRLGRRARELFYEGIVSGAYQVVDLPEAGYARAAELDRTYSDLALGLVDAALVAHAEALSVPWIATSDRRDFEPLVAPLGLKLVP